MPNLYRVMHENDMDIIFEVTPEIVQIIDQANNHLPAETMLKGINEFIQRIAININNSE